MVRCSEAVNFPLKSGDTTLVLKTKVELIFPSNRWILWGLHLPTQKLGCEMESQLSLSALVVWIQLRRRAYCPKIY